MRSLALTLVGFAGLTALILWLDDRNSTTITGHPRVVDGDSLLMNGRRLRLMGIDAPELGQDCQLNGQSWRCGIAAKSALQNLVQGVEIECQTHGLDRYQRRLAVCKANGTEINARLVELGWAIDFGGYASEEGAARRNNAGLWRGEFDRPQDWRAAHWSHSSATPVSLQTWWQRTRKRLGEIVFQP